MSGSINSRVKQTSSKGMTLTIEIFENAGGESKPNAVLQVPIDVSFTIVSKMNELLNSNQAGDDATWISKGRITKEGKRDESTEVHTSIKDSTGLGWSIKTLGVSVKGDNELHVRYTTSDGKDLTELLRSTLFIRAAYSLLGVELTPEEAATVDVRIRDYTGSGRKRKDPEPAKNYLKPIHLGKALAKASNPTLFDVEIDRGRMEASGGIIGELTEGKWKMVDALMDLLNSTSQTKDRKAPDYFMGNAGGEFVTVGGTKRKGGVEMGSPAIRVTRYELARAYKGGATPNGKDVKNAMANLEKMDKDLYMMQYKFTQDGTEYEVRERQKLIRLQVATKKSNTDTQEALIIALNPLFKLQIESLYINYPHDLLRRTMEAHGNPNVPASVFLLREYLFSEMVHKRTTGRANETITLRKLMERIAGNYLAQSRKKLAKEQTLRAIRTMENLGIIHGHRIEKSKVTGEDMVVFDINDKWPGDALELDQGMEVRVEGGA